MTFIKCDLCLSFLTITSVSLFLSHGCGSIDETLNGSHDNVDFYPGWAGLPCQDGQVVCGGEGEGHTWEKEGRGNPYVSSRVWNEKK